MTSYEVAAFVLACFQVLEDYYFMAFTLMIGFSVLIGVKRIFLEGND